MTDALRELDEIESQHSMAHKTYLDLLAVVDQYRTAIESALDIIPGAVRVREGGAREDLLASLAVTASKLSRA